MRLSSTGYVTKPFFLDFINGCKIKKISDLDLKMKASVMNIIYEVYISA